MKSQSTIYMIFPINIPEETFWMELLKKCMSIKKCQPKNKRMKKTLMKTNTSFALL